MSDALDRLRIGEALAKLSAADRDVLRRSCYEGRTTAQIADDLHIANDTVKSTLHHTVQALRRTLQEMGVPNRGVVTTGPVDSVRGSDPVSHRMVEIDLVSWTSRQRNTSLLRAPGRAAGVTRCPISRHDAQSVHRHAHPVPWSSSVSMSA